MFPYPVCAFGITAQPHSLKSVKFADLEWGGWGEVYVSSALLARACPEVRVTQWGSRACEESAPLVVWQGWWLFSGYSFSSSILGFSPSPHLYGTTQSGTFTLVLKIEAVYIALPSVHA